MPVEIGKQQLADAKNGVIHVTHNNDRKHYTIAIDIAKEGDMIWDLTPYFKAREGDSDASLDVTWYKQGQLHNSTEGTKPYIEGAVNTYFVDSNGQIQLDPGARPVSYLGPTTDVGDGGRVSYHFPPEMFPAHGIFKGYIGLADDRGRVSGVTIWFKVLNGIARMGHAKEVYVSEIEAMKLEFAAEQRAKIAEFDKEKQDKIAQFKADIESIKKQMDADYKAALDKHNQSFDDEMASIKDKLDEANQLAQSILDSDKLLDKALDANTEAVQNHLAPVLNQSNVFMAQNTFKEGAVMQDGLTVNGPLLVNGVDLSKLADQVNKLQIDVNKVTGGN